MSGIQPLDNRVMRELD